MHRRQFLQMGVGAVALRVLDTGGAHGQVVRDLSAPQFSSMRRFAATTHGRIAYVEQGRQPAAALLLHGFPLNSFQWRGVIPRLSAHRRCLAPDFLGLGYTEVAAGHSVAPDAQVAMIAEFLDRLSIRMVDVIANDSGGAIAQLLVARHPGRVRSLLLTNCDTEIDSPPAAVLPVIELAHAGRYADEWLSPWLADKVLARSAEGLGGLCYEDPAHLTDDAIDVYLGPLVSSPAREALTNAYAIGLAPNPLAGLESSLVSWTLPVRIVWGTADTIFSQKSPEYLHERLRNSRGIRRVPGAKLFFPEEMPDLIAEEAIRLWGV
ncbi:MAG TPA: alpha/beta hydrolase [Vicinamibacterales bacterium]|nr:alpha/beta hydrolase [Vicinamibacterales bacterium]